MRLPSKESLTKRLAHVRAGLSHAFATTPDAAPLSVEDVALLERVAGPLSTGYGGAGHALLGIDGTDEFSRQPSAAFPDADH